VRPGRAADHSPPSSAAVMEEKGYTSTHPLGHTGPVMVSLYFLFRQSRQIGHSKITSMCAVKRHKLMTKYSRMQLSGFSRVLKKIWFRSGRGSTFKFKFQCLTECTYLLPDKNSIEYKPHIPFTKCNSSTT